MAGRILVVDDVSTRRITRQGFLSEAFFEVGCAESTDDPVAAAREFGADLVILDAGMPPEAVKTACLAFQGSPLPNAPARLVIGPEATRITALEAGADAVLPTEVPEAEFLSRVRNLVRSKHVLDEIYRHRQTAERFGLNDAPVAFLARPTLGFLGPEPLRDQLDALRLGEVVPLVKGDAPYDGMILTAGADPGATARQIASARSSQDWRHIPVLVMTDGTPAKARAMLYDLGANDVVDQRVGDVELGLRLTALLRQGDEIRRVRQTVESSMKQAVRDPLTGLHNRRYAIHHLEELAQRARDSGKTYAVLLADLDRFKLVNDRYGHAVGDAILSGFADRLRENLRGVDLVARLGGDEFLIALPNASDAEAAIVAERLRHDISATPFILEDRGLSLNIAASFGVAIGLMPDGTAHQMLEIADGALYQSKAEGRNHVTLVHAA